MNLTRHELMFKVFVQDARLMCVRLPRFQDKVLTL